MRSARLLKLVYPDLPRRIYVKPTVFGGGHAAVSVVTLLASINYGLNLGYAMSFLLMSAWVVTAVRASEATKFRG